MDKIKITPWKPFLPLILDNCSNSFFQNIFGQRLYVKFYTNFMLNIFLCIVPLVREHRYTDQRDSRFDSFVCWLKTSLSDKQFNFVMP